MFRKFHFNIRIVLRMQDTYVNQTSQAEKVGQQSSIVFKIGPGTWIWIKVLWHMYNQI